MSRPARVRAALGVLSSGERLSLAALCNFHSAREGGTLLGHCGFHGLAELGGLDLQRHRVIADLLLDYDGW